MSRTVHLLITSTKVRTQSSLINNQWANTLLQVSNLQMCVCLAQNQIRIFFFKM